MPKWYRKLSLRKRWTRNHLINKYGAICYACGEPFKRMRDITIDHIVPQSKGGKDTIENMQFAHLHCNQLKSNMTLEDFRLYQQDLGVDSE